MATQLSEREREALEYLYSGGDETIECWSASWVKIRHSQKCVSILHKGKMTQPPGTPMIVECAKVEGRFGSCYTCVDCIRKAAKEIE